MECTHIVPQALDARQGQRLSMLIASLITRPARYEVGPSWTTPFSTGGLQFEESTRPPTTAPRACLITSQPAIFAKNCSFNSGKLISSAPSPERSRPNLY